MLEFEKLLITIENRSIYQVGCIRQGYTVNYILQT